MIKHIIAAVLLGFFFMAGPAHAADPVYTGTFSDKALSGYDTVAYFTQGAPVKGSEDFQTEYKDAKWLFSSQENLDAFKADPDKYAPQYGGYCAWAVAHDNLVKADPKNWHIENDKLYLNYDDSIQEKWLPRKAELIEKGDEKFPELLAE